MLLVNDEIRKYLDAQIKQHFASRLEQCFKDACDKSPILQALQSDIFYPNIPEADHSPSDDQPLMQLNNQKIFKQWGVNHTGITDTSNFGKHTRIDLKNFTNEQNAEGGFGLLYMLNNRLVIKDSNNQSINLTGHGSIGTSGWVRIPIGQTNLTYQWGTGGGGNGTTINFPVQFEDTPACFLTLERGSGARSVWVIQGSRNRSNFRMGTDASTTNFNWQAIGR